MTRLISFGFFALVVLGVFALVVLGLFALVVLGFFALVVLVTRSAEYPVECTNLHQHGFARTRSRIWLYGIVGELQ